MKELRHKAIFSQGDVKAIFRLTDDECKALTLYMDGIFVMFNFSAFEWANEKISKSKRKRFNRLFTNDDEFSLIEVEVQKFVK